MFPSRARLEDVHMNDIMALGAEVTKVSPSGQGVEIEDAAAERREKSRLAQQRSRAKRKVFPFLGQPYESETCVYGIDILTERVL